MKRWLIGLTMTAIALIAAADSPTETKGAAPTFKDLREKASFSAGLNIGRVLRRDFGGANSIDVDVYVRGLKAGLAGKAPLSVEEMREALMKYSKEVAESANTKFLEENRNKEGVKTTASGLQYQVLKAGDGGRSPKATETVSVHYRGTLVNGKQFDSSYDRGAPTEFPVNRVISGWTEALQLMKVGDKWRLVIPAKLAYREQGSPPDVPPNAVLIFEVELLAIK